MLSSAPWITFFGGFIDEKTEKDALFWDLATILSTQVYMQLVPSSVSNPPLDTW